MMETNRIILRLWHENDAEALFKYASEPEAFTPIDCRNSLGNRP